MRNGCGGHLSCGLLLGLWPSREGVCKSLGEDLLTESRGGIRVQGGVVQVRRGRGCLPTPGRILLPAVP